MDSLYDLVVIGAGPGGEVGAIRAAQLGLKVALVEKNIHLGGTCLNVGCIPTKCLLESAKTWSKLQDLEKLEKLGFQITEPKFDWAKIMERKNSIVDAQRKGLKFLMKKNQIDLFHGHGRFLSGKVIEVTAEDGSKKSISTRHTLLATGSRVKDLGIAPSQGSQTILNSDSVLSISHVPESLAIVGGGVVGMEFASIFGRFGTKVTVIEMAEQVLPFEDAECSQELVKQLKKQNVQVETKSRLTKIEDKKDHVLLTTEGQAARRFEKVLISIGRDPVTQDIGLDKLKIQTDRGYIPVDRHFKTTAPSVFAIGDIIKTPALAHTASAEALHAVEIIAGHSPLPINYEANPSAIYTYPEIASIGQSEASLKEKKVEYKVSKFPFSPMAKAKIEDAVEGFIKILYGPQFREILGVHIIGARATELIAEFSLAKVLESTVDEIASTIHPHPTISETISEAAHAALGPAIHI
ncbi:MAG: dihydrolipoyl dehydrogenase [Oligoflexales bacterium]|nr:dihydrolipoyl dehydrogenase [Oligoflexales bacterium]